MRKILAILATIAMVMGVSSIALATQPDPNHKVTICHRTNSTKNPYVKITVDEASVNKDTGDDKGQGDHNAQHNGPVWNSSMPNGGDWGDIIPPFYANGDNGYWPSKNWTAEGQAIFNNGCNPVPEPVQHDPTLEGSAVCHPADEQYVVKYTGDTDGADSTVPDLPVIRTLPGTTTHDSQTVTFKYSDGPDVSRTAHVQMAGDCTKDSPVTHEPTLQAAAVCDLVAEEYTVTYTGNTDGAESTVPALPVIHVVPATDKDQKDSATVTFKYSDGPDVTLTASITLPAGCVTEVKGEREHHHHNNNNDTNVKGGFAYTL